ncbi:MAG: beta-lactamase family protein [Candidatus Zixiibacteriota bacterium]|nr:MAG: beta-lactamase family protein [candidate division Zixibacteria bacterium]
MLVEYFHELEKRGEFSGVILITQGTAHLFAGAYGYASRAWKIRNTMDMRFDTASITKLFTSVATLQLIDQGLLDFETGAIDFLGLEDTAISREVNVFHLLTHTSGIGDDCEEEDGKSYEDLWKTKPNYSVRTTSDFLPQFINNPPNFPPGQGCRYCNCSFVLLGLMIEKVSGSTYRDYVGKNVFARARMVHSNFFRMDRVHDSVAEGYDPIYDDRGTIQGWKKNIYSFPPIGSPDSGAHVTAGDLDRFFRSVKAGELLSPGLTQAFLTPQVHYRDMDNWVRKYGYGLWFYVNRSGNVICCQKEGINAGVSGLIRHFPARDINVIILSNMIDGAWKPVWKIHEMVLAEDFGASR